MSSAKSNPSISAMEEESSDNSMMRSAIKSMEITSSFIKTISLNGKQMIILLVKRLNYIGKDSDASKKPREFKISCNTVEEADQITDLFRIAVGLDCRARWNNNRCLLRIHCRCM